MFTFKKIGIVIGVTGALAIGLAGSAFAQSSMLDGKHDLGGDIYTSEGLEASANGQICIYCHTPHNADANGVGALWARDDSTLATFAVYTSGSIQNNTGGTDAIGVETLACLSCHDGTIALDEALGGTTDMGDLTGGSTAVITDLQKQHPVGLTITGADDGIVTMVDGALGGLPLFASTNDQMECATCHDVHSDSSNGYFLRVSNTNSGLCTTCHTNK